MDDLESPYYLIHGWDPLEERLSNLQNYCRYMGDQPWRLVTQELQNLWKLHAKLLAENRIVKPATNKKVTKASDLKIGQLVHVKNHCKGPFNPTYIYDHWVAGIPNDSPLLLTTPDGKERKCNIHHVKLVSSLDVYIGSQAETPTGPFHQFWTAYSRTLVLTTTLIICTTYSQKQENHKYIYIFTYKYALCKKFNTIKIETNVCQMLTSS